MIYPELKLNERQNDLWFKGEDMYAIVLMYSVNEQSEPRFVTGGPYRADQCQERLEAMLNAVEQERFVCVSSHFVHPKNVICIRVAKWKDKKDRILYDGEFYE